MLNAKITITGSKSFLNTLKRIESMDLSDVGELVRQRMIDVIDENRKTDVKQPEQRFPDAPYSKHISDVLDVKVSKRGITIGNVAKMDKEVPYWRLINDGGKIKGEPHGAFLGGQGSSFQWSMYGPKMEPKTLIKPMHYIEKTAAWIYKNMRRFISGKVTKAFKDNRQKDIIRIV